MREQSVDAEDLTIYAKLGSFSFGALVHALHVVAPSVDATVSAARLFDGSTEATRMYVDARALNLPPQAVQTIETWPVTPGSLFDFADKQAIYDQEFRPQQLVDDAAYTRLGLFRPLDTYAPIVDAYCLTCPVGQKSWCMLAFLRSGNQKPFAPREMEKLQRLKPAIARLIRTHHQRRTRTADESDASSSSPIDPTVLLGKLSQTERHILQMLLAGDTERKIGQTLHRSPHTVHVHVKNTYRKLGVNSRRQLQNLFNS